MEFPELGNNCSWLFCKELDFLPMTCSYCKLIFCRNHIHVDQHKCSSAKCEKEEQPHFETFICTYEGCKSYSAVEMKCLLCQKHFCLAHRHHGCSEPTKEEIAAMKIKWDAPKQQFAQSISEINKIVNEGLKKSLQNPKKQEAAQKINLMRLKGKAQGPAGIPTESKIYFSIFLPKGSKNPICKPVFVSKDWSLGKVIDSVSAMLHVQNKNNVAGAKKLRLFKRTDGVQLSTDLSVKIVDLITENKINNGESIILEYVDPEEDLSCYYLKNVEEYIEL